MITSQQNVLSSVINLLVLIQDGTSKLEMEVYAEYWTEFDCDDINLVVEEGTGAMCWSQV